MSTISTTITGGITLASSGTYASPLTITSDGYVDNPGTGDAILGPNTQHWTVVNYGRVASIGSAGQDAIDLGEGGLVLNSGTIGARQDGVFVSHGSGTVINSGTISGIGTAGVAVDLTAGGVVNNASGALIAGTDLGVGVESLSGTVANSGTIQAVGTALSAPLNAVFLGAGGTVTNSAGGLIEGGNGVNISGVPGAVINAGTIQGTASYGEGVGIGEGDITNSSGGLIEGWTGVASGGPGTLINSGTIVGTAGAGASLRGGPIANMSGGLILGVSDGIVVGAYPATIINSGTIVGIGTAGVELYDGGSVFNAPGGLIQGHTGIYIEGPNGPIGTVDNAGTVKATAACGVVVHLLDGGTITNEAGGVIIGSRGVYLDRGSGSVMNAGYIKGSDSGVAFAVGGGVTNEPGGLIIGSIGVDIVGGRGTVSNYGTIVGAGLDPGVYLGKGGTVVNSGGLVEGTYFGIEVQRSAGTVINSGTIVGAGLGGVGLFAGGSVINNSSGLISGALGLGIWNGAGNVINYGKIESNPTNAAGVLFMSGGAVTNNIGGLISGRDGVEIVNGAPGTVINAGTIAGSVHATSVAGVYFNLGGSVINKSSGVITGEYGVLITAPGMVFNGGTIIGSGGIAAVEISGGGSVTNYFGGLIGGAGADGIYIKTSAGTVVNAGTIVATGAGIVLSVGGTVINAGTIVGGTSYDAVQFVGSHTNRLIVDPGAVFVGALVGGSGTDTLELDGSAGNSLTVNYNSLGLSNFEDVAFGSGGYATLAVANVSGTLGVTVSDFKLSSEIVDLTAIGTDGQITNNDTVNHLLTIAGSGGTVTLQLDASDAISFTTASDNAAGTEILVEEPVCFCRETLILTKRGEVPIEQLRIGDKVRTLAGVLKPITWIGYGRRLLTDATRNARPMIVRRGALSDGVPHSDLRLTRGHSLYLDGILVPVEYLLNGCTVLWDQSAREVEFYHIELRDHDVVVANGAPAETYREDGNRALFDNSDRPRFSTAQSKWFAPVLTGGLQVDALWRRIVGRSGLSSLPLVDDPDLHLMVDASRVDPIRVEPGRHPFQGVYHFRIDRLPAASLYIASRQVVPALVGLNRDPRQLGVAVRLVTMGDGRGPIAEISYSSHLLGHGFNEPEPEEAHRWTTGTGALPHRCLALYDGPFEIAIEIVCTARYPTPQATPSRMLPAA